MAVPRERTGRRPAGSASSQHGRRERDPHQTSKQFPMLHVGWGGNDLFRTEVNVDGTARAPRRPTGS